MGECVVLFLVGLFLVFYSCIFGIAILLLFQMIVWGVLSHVCCICLCDIVAIAILVWWLGWW